MKNKLVIITIVVVIGFSMIACSKSGGGSSGGGKSLNSPEALKEYLDKKPANSPDKPIKVSMAINGPMLKSVANVIKATGKYVILNIFGNALTEIPDYAFKNCETLVGINIPNSVKTIGGEAFSKCSNLSSITIPNSVETIGGSAFYQSGNLTSVTIGSGVTNIWDCAFFLCYNLTSVTFKGTIIPHEYGYLGHGPAFNGDLDRKYLAGGIGTYTTTAPVNDNSKWTKQ